MSRSNVRVGLPGSDLLDTQQGGRIESDFLAEQQPRNIAQQRPINTGGDVAVNVAEERPVYVTPGEQTHRPVIGGFCAAHQFAIVGNRLAHWLEKSDDLFEVVLGAGWGRRWRFGGRILSSGRKDDGE